MSWMNLSDYYFVNDAVRDRLDDLAHGLHRYPGTDPAVEAASAGPGGAGARRASGAGAASLAAWSARRSPPRPWKALMTRIARGRRGKRSAALQRRPGTGAMPPCPGSPGRAGAWGGRRAAYGACRETRSNPSTRMR
jgi:hypothetical protein